MWCPKRLENGLLQIPLTSGKVFNLPKDASFCLVLTTGKRQFIALQEKVAQDETKIVLHEPIFEVSQAIKIGEIFKYAIACHISESLTLYKATLEGFFTNTVLSLLTFDEAEPYIKEIENGRKRHEFRRPAESVAPNSSEE